VQTGAPFCLEARNPDRLIQSDLSAYMGLVHPSWLCRDAARSPIITSSRACEAPARAIDGEIAAHGFTAVASKANVRNRAIHVARKPAA